MKNEIYRYNAETKVNELIEVIPCDIEEAKSFLLEAASLTCEEDILKAVPIHKQMNFGDRTIMTKEYEEGLKKKRTEILVKYRDYKAKILAAETLEEVEALSKGE